MAETPAQGRVVPTARSFFRSGAAAVPRHRCCAAPGAFSIPRPWRRRQPHPLRRLLPARCSAPAPPTAYPFSSSPRASTPAPVDRAGNLRRRLRLAHGPQSFPGWNPFRSHISILVRCRPDAPYRRRARGPDSQSSPTPSASRTARVGFSCLSSEPVQGRCLLLLHAKKFVATVATTDRFTVRNVSRTGLRHRRKLRLVTLPVGATVALPVRTLLRISFHSRSRVASAAPLKRRRAPSLRSTGTSNRPWCAPSFSLISTPGGVLSHTRRILNAPLCKRAHAQHLTASIAGNQQSVMPGKVAHSGIIAIALILHDYLSRDVTVATPVHGGCPMVAPVLRPWHRSVAWPMAPMISDSGQSMCICSPIEFVIHLTLTRRLQRLEISTNRIQSGQILIVGVPILECFGMPQNRQSRRKP